MELFTQLRNQVIKEQQRLVRERRENNPEYSTEERQLGIYFEELEPQVRDAVLDLNRKGYPTYYSGFYDFDNRYQVIEGKFQLLPQVAEQLEAHGAEVMIGPMEEFGLPANDGHITIVQFQATTPDLSEIETRWNSLAALIPARNVASLDVLQASKYSK